MKLGRDHRQGEGKEEVETVGKEKVKKVRRCRQHCGVNYMVNHRVNDITRKR